MDEIQGKSMRLRTAQSLAATGSQALDRFKVITEFNRNFPGGLSAARLTLLRAYASAASQEFGAMGKRVSKT